MLGVEDIKRTAQVFCELMVTITTLLVINSILVVPVLLPAALAFKKFMLRVM